jgi:hypothetical protein
MCPIYLPRVGFKPNVGSDMCQYIIGFKHHEIINNNIYQIIKI